MSENEVHNNGDAGLPLSAIHPIALNMTGVVVGADRSLEFEQDQPRESKYQEIREKFSSPDFQTKETLRLILVQMTMVINDMRARENDPNAAAFIRFCSEEIRALRALAKQVEETDRLSHLDVLDFDGPKFKYVLKQLAASFKQAALNVLGKDHDEMVNRIMIQFRDIATMNDEEIRRNTKKIR
jgi:hypothetical protein